jgi:hypothetical protein
MDIARMALNEIRAHDGLCTVRYAVIEKNQNEAKQERKDMHQANQNALLTLGGRVDRLYNRAWAVVGAIIGIETLAIIGVIAWAVHKTATP